MIYVRTPTEIELIRQCGMLNAQIHKEVQDFIRSGVTTQEINDKAAACMNALGVKSSIREPEGFPGDICVSVNEEVGHGVPGADVLKDGDVVKVDISVEFAGYHTDCAITHIVGIGEAEDSEAKRLVSSTREALFAGISAARAERRCSDISHAVYRKVQEHGYAVIRHAFGHGVGRSLHESPQIASFGPAGCGPRLRPGMIIAIEPVVSAGGRFTVRNENGWTDTTIDGSIGAHFEHTVLITDGEPEILTQTAHFETDTAGSDTPFDGIVYRDRVDADKPALLQLAAQEMDAILMQAWGRKVSPQEILDPDAQTIVLQHESGNIAGFFVFSEIGDALHLNTLVIHPMFQGKGIGTQVMKRMGEMALGRNLKGTRLCVQTNNHRALAFYQKLGYAVYGEPYPNTLLMRKSRS